MPTKLRSRIEPEPTAKRDALVRRVLDAALELFAEGGYHGTSIPTVMERAR